MRQIIQSDVVPPVKNIKKGVRWINKNPISLLNFALFLTSFPYLFSIKNKGTLKMIESIIFRLKSSVIYGL